MVLRTSQTLTVLTTSKVYLILSFGDKTQSVLKVIKHSFTSFNRSLRLSSQGDPNFLNSHFSIQNIPDFCIFHDALNKPVNAAALAFLRPSLMLPSLSQFLSYALKAHLLRKLRKRALPALIQKSAPNFTAQSKVT